MPQRGRPPQPGTAEEKAAIRREKVRLYVKAHRERKKNAESIASSTPSSRQSKSTSPAASSSDAVNRCVRAKSYDSTGPKDSKVTQGGERVIKGYTAPNPTLSKDQWMVTKPRIEQGGPNLTIAVPPRGNKELGLALLGAFRGQLLPPALRVPSQPEFGSELVTPCSPWITNAYAIAVGQDSGALKSSLLAVGLALTGIQHQDERLRMASLDVYRKALRQVRNDIKPLSNGHATNYLIPYLSCLAAAMFEILHDGFSENIMQHVKGATSLIEHLPKDVTVNHLLGDLLLEDLCMWEIVFALKYRYPSPLRAIRRQKGARNYVIHGDRLTQSGNATIFGDLLDCADEISTIMTKIDHLKTTPSSDSRKNDLQGESDNMTRILQAFDAWISRFLNRFGPIYVQVGTDEATGTPITQFASYEIAAAWVYCLTLQICALETNIEALTALSQLAQSEPTFDHSQARPAHTHTHTHHKPEPTMPPFSQSFTTIPPEIHGRQTPNADVSRWQMQLTALRSRLRLTTAQLVEALCLFLPIPKGIIGSSLVLFPLDRAKAMLKREIARLQDDRDNVKMNGMEDDAAIAADLNDMIQSMTIHENLEQALAQFGMPPMQEDRVV